MNKNGRRVISINFKTTTLEELHNFITASPLVNYVVTAGLWQRGINFIAPNTIRGSIFTLHLPTTHVLAFSV